MTDPRTADARTDLRDARLEKALAHAPDAQALPAVATRNTIKKIANNLVEKRAAAVFDTKIPWWKAFWQKTGRAGRGGPASGPWNAAFATLLLGSIITLIWQRQEVPDAVLDERPAVARNAPEVTPAPTREQAVKPPVPITVPAPPPEPAWAKTPRPRPPSQQRGRQEPVPAEAAVLPTAPNPGLNSAPPTTGPGAPAQSPLRREAPAVEKPESPASVAPSTGKSMSDMAAVPQQARTQVGAASPSSPALAAPAAAPAPSPAPSAAGSITERIARTDSNNRNRTAMLAPSALEPAQWTAADLLYQTRSIRLARRDAQNLANRVVALAVAHAATSINADGNVGPLTKADSEGGTPLLRLQLVDQGNPATVAQFDLWGNNVFRWRRAGQTDVAGALTPDAVAGLLAQAARALPP